MSDFNQDFARFLLELCRYTYSRTYAKGDDKEKVDRDDAFRWITDQKSSYKIEECNIHYLNDGKGDQSTSVACVFCYDDKNIIAYMGTKTEFKTVKDTGQSILDWAKNLRFVPVRFEMSKKQLGLDDTSSDLVELSGSDGLVHHGFLNELGAVQERIIEILRTNGGKQRDLYITGHSQGGAEAALATRVFQVAGFNVKATYTFAAPRSANKFVTEAIKDIPVFRLEFGNDIVPHVPTTYLGHTINADLVNGLRKLGFFQDLLPHLDDKYHWVGIGLLCYGDNVTKTLKLNIDAAGEATLLNQRIRAWMDPLTLDELIEHHHLAGTSKEVKEGRKGNYTALVSAFSVE